jgi:2-oxoglutarate dehydrogenase E2 component (dihydrolipoamide succinyltransferase)
MPTNVQVPGLGESVTEAVLIKWHKNDGEMVKTDEPLCELETDKANVDVPSPGTGVVKRMKPEGAKVRIGETIATIDPSAKPSSSATTKPPMSSAGPPPAPQKASVTAAPPSAPATKAQAAPAATTVQEDDLAPAVRRLVTENQLDASKIPGTGRGGRLTKEDVLKHLESRGNGNAQPPLPSLEPPPDERASDIDAAAAITSQQGAPATGTDGVRRVAMSKIRKRIAENLVRAQQTAAILTTFNEIDLSEVMELRARHKERFEKLHGVGLGFMSFFVKATTLALKAFERVNAALDGDDIVYHDYVHMGIAVSTDRGLAVPVLRNVEKMSFAKIEAEIKRLAAATRDGKLSLQELSGGTFTITNGGIFGSLLSTPILNPPQSGILGMHAIQKRPVVVNDKIEIRPMMYVALSYDHRLVDGRESVSFLVRIKELLEDPARLMLEI